MTCWRIFLRREAEAKHAAADGNPQLATAAWQEVQRIQTLADAKKEERDEAMIIAAAEERKCEIVAGAEIRIINANEKEAAAEQKAAEADKVLRKNDRVVFFAFQREDAEYEYHDVCIQSFQDEDLFVGIHGL